MTIKPLLIVVAEPAEKVTSMEKRHRAWGMEQREI